MVGSDHRQSETVSGAADDEWVCLQHDGGTLKLLEGQDGDEKERIRNMSERPESSKDMLRLIRVCRSAWNDVSVRNAFWDDMRPYVLIAAVSVYMILSLLATLAASAERKSVQFALTCLRHCTMAILYAAASSCAARFLSLVALKASVVRTPEVKQLLLELLTAQAWILWSVIRPCVGHVSAGITFFQVARRREHFMLPLQLLADVVRVEALTGAMVLTVWLVFLMATDIKARYRDASRLCTDIWEARRRGAIPWTSPGLTEDSKLMRDMVQWMAACTFGNVVFFIVFLISPNRAFPSGHA
uniref:Gustatory receptor n=1 Tax=Rhipicephalus appendiculatus TaxID=34631 RepID=A0A131YGD3_RHIAP